MGWEKDLPPGDELVACFRPFLEHLVGSELSPKTIQKHADNLWVLGGEIIRDLNEDPSLRKRTVERLLHDAIDADGGPLLHNGSEEEQRSFDSTAADSTASSLTQRARPLRGEKGSHQATPMAITNPSDDPASYPQIPRTRRLYKGAGLYFSRAFIISNDDAL